MTRTPKISPSSIITNGASPEWGSTTVALTGITRCLRPDREEAITAALHRGRHSPAGLADDQGLATPRQVVGPRPVEDIRNRFAALNELPTPCGTTEA